MDANLGAGEALLHQILLEATLGNKNGTGSTTRWKQQYTMKKSNLEYHLQTTTTTKTRRGDGHAETPF